MPCTLLAVHSICSYTVGRSIHYCWTLYVLCCQGDWNTNVTLVTNDWQHIIWKIYWTKKERYNFSDFNFLSSHLKWIYGIWNIVNSHIPFRLWNKYSDQSSVKRLSRQRVEFQKVCAGLISTTKVSMCVDRRYLYFFPDGKSTKCWRKTYALECNSVKQMLGFFMNGCWKRKIARKMFYLLLTDNFTTQYYIRGVSI